MICVRKMYKSREKRINLYSKVSVFMTFLEDVNFLDLNWNSLTSKNFFPVHFLTCSIHVYNPLLKNVQPTYKCLQQ